MEELIDFAIEEGSLDVHMVNVLVVEANSTRKAIHFTTAAKV